MSDDNTGPHQNQHSESDLQSEHERRRIFGELAAVHENLIRNFVRSLGVASSDVDDISQEALLVAYRKFEDFELGTSFPAWVCSIARNLMWSECRKKTPSG